MFKAPTRQGATRVDVEPERFLARSVAVRQGGSACVAMRPVTTGTQSPARVGQAPGPQPRADAPTRAAVTATVPDAMRELADGVEIDVVVVPRASRSQVVGATAIASRCSWRCRRSTAPRTRSSSSCSPRCSTCRRVRSRSSAARPASARPCGSPASTRRRSVTRSSTTTRIAQARRWRWSSASRSRACSRPRARSCRPRRQPARLPSRCTSVATIACTSHTMPSRAGAHARVERSRARVHGSPVAAERPLRCRDIAVVTPVALAPTPESRRVGIGAGRCSVS